MAHKYKIFEVVTLTHFIGISIFYLYIHEFEIQKDIGIKNVYELH